MRLCVIEMVSSCSHSTLQAAVVRHVLQCGILEDDWIRVIENQIEWDLLRVRVIVRPAKQKLSFCTLDHLACIQG